MTIHRQHIGITWNNSALTIFVLEMRVFPRHDLESVSSSLRGKRCGKLRPILDRVVIWIKDNHSLEPHIPWIIAWSGIVLFIFIVAPADPWKMRAIRVPVCVLDLEGGLIIRTRACRIWVT